MPVRTEMPHVPLPDNPLRRTRIQVTIILTSIQIIMAKLNWDIQFHLSRACIYYADFTIESELSVGKLRITITRNGTTTSYPIVNHFFGYLKFTYGIVDQHGQADENYPEPICSPEYDCEVCSYIDNGQIKYHLLNADEDLKRDGYTIIPDNQYTIEYTDK